MLLEGIKLLVLGMGIVFAFLCILMSAITALGARLSPLSEAENWAGPAESHKTSTPKNELVSVITAAIAAHRQRGNSG